jgi:hypothetical protein
VTRGQRPIQRGFLSIGLPPRPPGSAALARREQVYTETKFSDQAPLTIDCGFTL